jgi:enoyl-CoA hydratase/carnithine racemase
VNYETILYELRENIATVTLNRPEVLNAFNQRMCDEFTDAWRRIRLDDDVHVVVLQSAGDRAFSTGLDRRDDVDLPDNPWSQVDPGAQLSPKSNHVYKPVICALHGMCAGGAMYLVNDADIVICSEDTTFFDPHVTYGLVSSIEPSGMARRAPIGEVLRWALLGLDERMSAARALQIGLVSEVVPVGTVRQRARDLAAKIAAKPPAAVQGTVKAIWDGLELSVRQAQQIGLHYTTIGNAIGRKELGEVPKPQWELR